MRWVIVGALFVGCSLASSAAGAVPGERGGEAGVFAGVVLTDENLSLEDGGTSELTLGIRGGSVFARRWTWFTDILASRVSTAGSPLGDAVTYWGRTGFEYFLQPEKDLRWYLGGGAGWMLADFEHSGSADFDRPFVSGSFGQRWRLGPTAQLRWEIRGDITVDQEGLGEETVGQGLGTIGVIWGPRAGAVARRGSERPATVRPPREPLPVVDDDQDDDGVRDGRDRCNSTPVGAIVNSKGCPSDADSDGVPDGIDQCPGSPRGEAVNQVGCIADADGDGVRDRTDTCPATPKGAAVDDWGCPLDRDHDGIADGLDRCPTTPMGAVVDAEGCALDGDGDGVPDGLDECPDTAPGIAVAPSGCPSIGLRFDDESQSLVLWLGFRPGSATIDPGAASVLDEVQRQLEQVEGRFEVGGHADPLADGSDLVDLSERRAQAVVDALVDRGIPASRLEAHGYGASEAVSATVDRDATRHNRRVELHPN